VAGLVAGALTSVGLGMEPALGATAPTVPAYDSFYAWTGSLHSAPGTVLRTRTVGVADVFVQTPVKATQLLYVTTNELGQRVVSVATVLQPLDKVEASLGVTRIVSYQFAYDALSSICDPSYTMQGGNVADTTGDAEMNLLLAYVAEGYTVVASDYEGEDLAFGAGQQSGYETLDGIRAAEHWLGVTEIGTPVGMVGYSGGSIATDFAAELAPHYASDLDIVGVAEGGIPVDLFHNLAYIDHPGSGWTGVIPGVLDGLARGFDISNFKSYLTPVGVEAVDANQNQCIDNFTGLTTEQMFKPQYQDIEKIPLFVNDLNHLIMSRTGTPREPMLIGVGNSDGTGDTVMVTKDVQELAHTYCTRGVPVQFYVYKGLSHTYAAIPFETQANKFLAQRLAGQSVQDRCSSITSGNSLAPVPEPS
jgi:secretory lipase